MQVNFVTGNQYKFENAARYFNRLEGYDLVQLDLDTPEIQADTSEEIAMSSAIWAAKEKNEPCVKMDVSFHIEALRGFPGPYIKQINKWLTAEDMQRLLGTEENRRACFLLSLAIAWPDEQVESFTHRVDGTLASRKMQTAAGWVIDTLFVPEGFQKPLSELEKSQTEKVWGDGPWPQLINYLESQP